MLNLPHLVGPLLLSLRVAVVATVLVALIGVPLAYVMARRAFAGRSVVEAVLIVPLILPPTVVGYFILMLLGRRGPIGVWLDRWFGYSVLFNWHGAVIASAVVALPLLYLPARAAFMNLERELEDIARLMGASPLGVFWHVSLPMARRGIASGLLLAFARALGEFGATVMVMGDLAGRQTMPIAIYNDYVSGDLAAAAPAVVALTVVSLLVIVVYNRSVFGRRD
jgi:molybdate transport system permease protein